MVRQYPVGKVVQFFVVPSCLLKEVSYENSLQEKGSRQYPLDAAKRKNSGTIQDPFQAGTCLCSV